MNIESEINKELFVPQNERLLVVLEVQRRQKKRRSFLPTSSREDYTTFIYASSMNLVIYRCKAFLGRVKKLMVARQKDKGQTGSRGAQRTVGNVVQRMTVALGERGGRLTRAEDRTVRLMHKAQQIADTAHKQHRLSSVHY
uniref:Syntaxin binding protein 6 (amisyn), like n=1 Tax=Oryzias sinensis TaxID=183150 RepID=A0A8C8DQR5_9TELE